MILLNSLWFWSFEHKSLYSNFIIYIHTYMYIALRFFSSDHSTVNHSINIKILYKWYVWYSARTRPVQSIRVFMIWTLIIFIGSRKVQSSCLCSENAIVKIAIAKKNAIIFLHNWLFIVSCSFFDAWKKSYFLYLALAFLNICFSNICFNLHLLSLFWRSNYKMHRAVNLFLTGWDKQWYILPVWSLSRC